MLFYQSSVNSNKFYEGMVGKFKSTKTNPVLLDPAFAMGMFKAEFFVLVRLQSH